MKYDKGSPLDKILTNFPARYIFYLFCLWLLVIIGLIYLEVIQYG